MDSGITPSFPGLRNQFLRQAIATTFDTYSHVLPGMQEEAAWQFDQGIAKARRERGIGQDRRSVSMSGKQSPKQKAPGVLRGPTLAPSFW